MHKTKTIKVSDFSQTPKGRYKSDTNEHKKDGNYTGERFRTEYIEPYFEEFDKFIIDLDNLYGCPSSFREEAFGGLARRFGIKKVLDKLEFICTDEPPLIDIIIGHIKDAND